MTKRVLDLVAATLLLILLSPVLVVTAAVLVLIDDRPILFRQARVGRHGRLFEIWKLRTMLVDAHGMLDRDPELHKRYQERGYKLELWEDPRVTSLGRILRRYSIDELPQLINVLRGEMSLVGPRPVVPAELEEYGPLADAYLHAWPGLTGIWQIAGRDEVKYPERAWLDADYVERWSLATDIRILLRTAPAALGARGVR